MSREMAKFEARLEEHDLRAGHLGGRSGAPRMHRGHTGKGS
jgi:hypothetical protein